MVYIVVKMNGNGRTFIFGGTFKRKTVEKCKGCRSLQVLNTVSTKSKILLSNNLFFTINGLILKKKYTKWLFLTCFIIALTLYIRYRINDPCQSFGITCLCKLDTQSPELILTFDDGPDSSITPSLLLLLEKLEVQAIFFVNGNKLELYPEIARRIVEKGHILANHSYQHEAMIFRTVRYIEKDLLKTDSLIRLAGQKDVPYYRPPYGKSFINLPRVLKKYGKKMVNWTIAAPAQYDIKLDKQQLVSETVKQLKPGSIILLHDGYPYQNRQAFLEAVEAIILHSRKRNFEFISLK